MSRKSEGGLPEGHDCLMPGRARRPTRDRISNRVLAQSRSRFYSAIRSFFDAHHFVEVEVFDALTRVVHEGADS
ncbi:MAG: hypothetical protein P8176_13240 [Gammaproteobacteria bacterium]